MAGTQKRKTGDELALPARPDRGGVQRAFAVVADPSATARNKREAAVTLARALDFFPLPVPGSGQMAASGALACARLFRLASYAAPRHPQSVESGLVQGWTGFYSFARVAEPELAHRELVEAIVDPRLRQGSALVATLAVRLATSGAMWDRTVWKTRPVARSSRRIGPNAQFCLLARTVLGRLSPHAMVARPLKKLLSEKQKGANLEKKRRSAARKMAARHG